MDRVPQAAHDIDPRAVASGGGNRESARRDDDGGSPDRRAAREPDAPGGCRGTGHCTGLHLAFRVRREARDEGLEAHLHAAVLGERSQSVPDVVGPVRNREELPRLLLEAERNAQGLLEEPPLLPKRPAEQELLERVRRGGRDEASGCELGRQHVATPAAAHEDLPAAVARALEQKDARGAACGFAGTARAARLGPSGEDRGQKTGRAGTDHDYRQAVFAHGSQEGINRFGSRALPEDRHLLG